MVPKNSAARSESTAAPLPQVSIGEALRFVRAFSKLDSAKPHHHRVLADSLELWPTCQEFVCLKEAAVAYGLAIELGDTHHVELTPLGQRIACPTSGLDEVVAMREALLQPAVFDQFLRSFDGKRLPRAVMSRQVLGELGVAPADIPNALETIIEGAMSVGLMTEARGEQYVDLSPVRATEREEA